MSDNEEYTLTVDFGLPNFLTAVMALLKFGGYIDYSWWVVWSPVLVYAGLTVLTLVILGVIGAIKK